MEQSASSAVEKHIDWLLQHLSVSFVDFFFLDNEQQINKWIWQHVIMAEQTELCCPNIHLIFLSFKTELMLGEAHVLFTDELRVLLRVQFHPLVYRFQATRQ